LGIHEFNPVTEMMEERRELVLDLSVSHVQSCMGEVWRLSPVVVEGDEPAAEQVQQGRVPSLSFDGKTNWFADGVDVLRVVRR